ncbi:MAG: YciI family protein [Alphaproteobacteria bacterium]
MGYAILAFDGADKTRRAAAMDRHRAVISRWAEDGRMPFGTPLFTAEWVPSGSLMILDVPDMAGVRAYLAEEPFSVEGVWGDVRILPFRIAPLPYQRLPKPGDPVASTRTHTVAIAYDGTDAEAPTRRLAARGAHIARMQPMAADGMLAVGGAILDEAESRMIGSITVTRHGTDEAARAWMAEDPYVKGGVWQDITLHATRLAALPYRPLPGAA